MGSYKTLLWEGTLSIGGTVTIPEMPYYNLFLVEQSVDAAVLIMTRYKARSDAYIAFSIYSSNARNSIQDAMHFRASGSSTKLMLSFYNRTYIDGTNASSSGNYGNATAIYGIL